MNRIVTAEIICVVFTVISLIVQLGERDNEKSSRLLKLNTSVILFWLLIDTTSYCTNLSYVPTLLTFSLGSVALLVFCRYCDAFISEKTEIKSRTLLLPKIICILCIITSVASFLMGKVVVYENGIAAEINGNPLLVQAMQDFVMLYIFIVVMAKGKNLGLKNVILLSLLDIAPMIAALLYIQTGEDYTVVISDMSVIAIVMFIQDEWRRVSIKERAEKEKEAAHQKNTELQLQHEQLRTEVYNYMIDHDDDPIELLKNFAESIRVLINCDQVIYRDLEEVRIMVNSPAIEETWAVPIEFCQQCEHLNPHHPMYAGGYTEMENCQEGWQGIPVYHECPIKSSLTRIVYCDGEIAGYLAIHYVVDYHHFTDIERKTLEEFTRILSISLSRYKAKQENRELKRMQEMQTQIDESNLIIGALAEDFGSVNYVELTDDKEHDFAPNYRTSELLLKLIPEWEREAVFTKKIQLLIDNVVYEPDKEKFYEDTRREVVLEHLKDSDTYFVNTRTFFDNEIKYYQMKFSAIRDDNDKIVSVVVGMHSIDEQMKKEIETQEHLAEALENAQSANKAKTTFLFNMSHDIRTPMNAILGYTDMAIRHLDDREATRDSLHKIKASGEHLLSLINDILEMSRIEAGKLELTDEPLDIREAIEGVENMSKALAIPKSINFEVKVGEIKNPYILADELHLNEVFINIISNAMKYSNEDGNVIYAVDQISDVENGTAWYQVKVTDDGIGMSEEFLEHIYETFAREKSSTVSKLEGAGLGLSIVKRIVDLAGGTIDIASKLGKGTTVTVKLPFRVMNDEQIEVFRKDHTDNKVREICDSITGKRVLVVEDNELNLEIAVDILEEEGLDVETAEDGSVAVDRLKEKGPDYYDFILMDIQMPVMNGYEATKAIREMYPDAGIPIIAVSANAFEEDKQKSIESGMNEHIAKPIDIQELIRTMAKYL